MISAVLMDKVIDLIEKRITAEELEEWLVPQLPTFIANPNSADSDLVSAIELGLIELNNGMRTYPNFIEFMREALLEHTKTIVLQITSAGSSNQTQHRSENTASDIIAVEWIQQ